MTENTLTRLWTWNQAHPHGSPVLAWPGLRSGEPLRTRTRNSAWQLGGGHLVVAVEGHPGGISLEHIEDDPTRQPAVPDVEFEMPPCPICTTSLESDGDSLVCGACRCSWDSNGTRGSWFDPNERRCLATRRAYPTLDSTVLEQCILAQDNDHGGSPFLHRAPDGVGSWGDLDRSAVADGDGEPAR